MRRIILLSDGTGNAANSTWKSNVWRLFESLDLRGDEQVAFYDDGVGTSSFKPLAILGGAFGWGLKRNVLDIYKFLCLNYQPTDQIFGFGFSRGAFTIRVVIGLVLSQGLVPGATDAETYENAKMAYRAYRAERFHTFLHIEWLFRKVRDIVLFVFGSRYDKRNNTPVRSIEFLGLWDTVAAYGLPVDEMARGVSQWIWPLELPDRSFNLAIQRAYHALSLDDERTTFHPVLWNEAGVPASQLTQVWFAGVHANVGGGYPDDSLAHIPLYSVMIEAQLRGLKFKTRPNPPNPLNDPDPDMVVNAQWRRDKDGRLYDSRNGLGGYYRYGPRKIEDLSHMRFSPRKDDYVDNNPPIIHETAVQRAIRGAHRYAPIGIPHDYSLMTDAGVVPQTTCESPAAADRRCHAQENVWNDVWRRRLIYFTTVFASIYLVIYPLAVTIDSSGEYATRLTLISSAIRALNAVLPSALSLWTEAYARDPSHFVVLGFLVVLLIGLGVALGSKIEAGMERVWRQFGPGRISKTEIAVRAGSLIVAAYVTFHNLLPASWPAQTFLNDHINGWVKAIVISTVVALFLPSRLVFHLRSWPVYRGFISLTKLYILPFVFAMSFLLVGYLFCNHLVFSIEDSFGMVCTESGFKEGLGACPAASIATCGPQGAAPNCSGGRSVSCGEGVPVCEKRTNPNCDPRHANCDYQVPVCHISVPSDVPGSAPVTKASGFGICPSLCEVRPSEVDRVTKHIDKFLDISSVCKATGIWLEQGQNYKVTIRAPGPNSPTAWKDDGLIVSTRGTDTSKMTLSQRLQQILYWPLKRHLFVDSFKVIARVGSTGSDERVLEPDDDKRSNDLDVVVTPRRSGELFLYVNDSIWASKGSWENFYNDNVGKATIEVKRTN